MARAGEMMAREFPYITSHANKSDDLQHGRKGGLQAEASGTQKSPFMASEEAT
jgi:hypothetical protein